MELLTQIILQAGRSAVELALFILLPIMVVMLSLMRLLEARGVIDRMIALFTPLLRPIGLTGLGIFAALQISFVSFAAPVATLAMMDQRGASERHIAATLALVMAMAQANVVFPMLAQGLQFAPVMLLSLLGGLVAAAATYHVFGRHLSDREVNVDETLHHPVAENTKGVLDVINRAGAEAFKIAVGAIPMLVLALVAVMMMRSFGLIDLLVAVLSPALTLFGIDPALILPTLTKYIAGGTALMGVTDEMLREGSATADTLNRSAGFLIHPFDVAGIAVLISAGPRVARIWKVAALGAVLGIAVRTTGHLLTA